MILEKFRDLNEKKVILSGPYFHDFKEKRDLMISTIKQKQ